MEYNKIWRCDRCSDEIETPSHPTRDNTKPGHCHCGGRYNFAGESYDQEFVDQMRYEQEQDREYEDRHRHDDYS
jgi:hypothetical protein